MTFSFRKISEKIVAKMGAEYLKETADAIGMICIALKNKNIASNPLVNSLFVSHTVSKVGERISLKTNNHTS